MKKCIVSLACILTLLVLPLNLYAGAPLLDTDSDGIPDEWDNCTLIANPSQFDGDGDGFGNICDPDVLQEGVATFTGLLTTLGVIGAIIDPTNAWMTFSEPPGAAILFSDISYLLFHVGTVMAVPPFTSGLACQDAFATPQPVIPPCTGV